MERAIRVSIIITSFNYGRFLRAAIDSALSQTYPHTEVIVVDDGSCDNSAAVIRSYENRIQPILKANGGQASAFNAGFANSHGDLICFLDSDDVLFSTATEKAVRSFEGSQAANIRWPLVIIDEHGNDTGRRLPLNGLCSGDLSAVTVSNGPFYDWNLTSPTSGNAWSRRFLEQVLPMPEGPYRTCADEYLLTLAPVFGPIANLNEAGGHYREHTANNGWRQPPSDSKLASDMKRFEFNCAVLSERLNSNGTAVDAESWKTRNWNYIWMARLQQAKQDLSAVISDAQTFILVDNADSGGALGLDHRAIPFLERNGEYWGPPPDDATAISELEKLRASGAAFLVFWWTAFWWLDHYSGFSEYLRSTYSCLMLNDRLTVFAL